MPNLLMERTEVEELIIGFDINQFITPEEDGDLPEICVQQGIDASAKKSPSKPKSTKMTKAKVKTAKNKAKKGIEANRKNSGGFKSLSQGKKAPAKNKGEKAARTKAMNKAMAKRKSKQNNPGGTKKPATSKKPKAAKAKSTAPKKPATTSKPAVSRGEQLRKKHGSAAAGYAAYRDKNVGSNKFRAGAKGFARTQSGKKSTGGVISRPQFMSGAIEKSINRKARKTGKSITATRKVNYSHEGTAPDINTHKFKGDPTKGGTRKPAKTKHAIKPFRRKKA